MADSQKIKNILQVIGFVCAFLVTVLVYTDVLTLSPNGLKNFNNLETFVDKLRFLLIHLTLPLLLLIIHIGLTIHKRATTQAINPSPENDHLTYQMNSILRNYFEQFIISVFNQLILITYCSSKIVLQTIPLMNYLFFIGRIAYYLTYPSGRTFGFLMGGLLPSSIACFVSTYMFFAYLF